MRAWFEPYFGELWTTVAVFGFWTLTVLIILLLAMWAFRRFSGVSLGRISRGRVPRLALVDAMAIDNRRRLVLVRRDNLEHLILIGGPTDTVVESAIQRPQLRKSAAGPAVREHAGTDPAPPPVRPASDLQSPAPPVAAAALPAQIGPAPVIERPAAASPLAEFQAPVSPAPQVVPPTEVAALDATGSPVEEVSPSPEPSAATLAAPLSQPAEAAATADAGATGDAPLDLPTPPLVSPAAEPAQNQPEAESSWANQPPSTPDDGGASPAATTAETVATAADADQPSDDSSPVTTARVDDLEREMARLLGEKEPQRNE